MMMRNATIAAATAAQRARSAIDRARRRRWAWLALAALGLALWAHDRFDATAAGEPYTVSLHSPASFPVDI